MNNKIFYELTNPQKAIWFTEQFYKNTSISNVSGTCIIDTDVNFELLNKAINLLIENHSELNIKLVIKNRNPYAIY